MRTKLPDCPRCSEDELWLWRTGDSVRVRCYLCGWDSDDIVLATGEDMRDVIAVKVETARLIDNKPGTL